MSAMLKAAVCAALVLMMASTARAAQESYRLDHARAELRFTVQTFFGMRWGGLFRDFNATLQIDRNRPDTAQLGVEVRADSLEAGIVTRTMLGAFDAERFPTIRFVSTRVTLTAPHRARIDGLLTLHGVTRPIVLDATLRDGDGLSFSATGNFRRSDFGITRWRWAADRVGITIEAAFTHAPA